MRLIIDCEHGRSEAHSLGPTTDYAWCCPVEAIGPDAILEALAEAGVLHASAVARRITKSGGVELRTVYESKVSPWRAK